MTYDTTKLRGRIVDDVGPGDQVHFHQAEPGADDTEHVSGT